MPPDKPNPYVYETAPQISTVAQHFTPQIELLHELCCYGSNLLIRCFTEKGRKLEDVVILGVLFRQFLVHLDATHVLVSQSCNHAALIHLRAMLEEQFYLEWISKKDTAIRAKHLYVWNLRKRRGFNNSTNPTTTEGRQIDGLLAVAHPDVLSTLRTPKIAAEAAKQNVEIDRILGQFDLAKIDRSFAALRGKRPRDPDWYAPCGPTSLYQIAKEVGMDIHYSAFYSKWSEMMHSSGLFEHLHTDSAGTSVQQIRSMEHFDEPIKMASLITFDIFKLIIKRYRPDEESAFAKKYVIEWRTRSFQVPNIKVNYST